MVTFIDPPLPTEPALTVRIGTAGWTIPPVLVSLRKKGGSHLHNYATIFKCAEINSSFSRSHRKSTYERWRECTPSDFAFSVKMPRSITHESALRRCRPEVLRFKGEIEGLGSKLHVLLVQLPPSLVFDNRSAAAFFAMVSATCEARIVCECRSSSWFTPRAEALLLRMGVTRVGADPPKAPGGAVPGGAPHTAYWRLHGSPRVYYSRYTSDFLGKLAGEIRRRCTVAKEAWCIFDNTAGHQAWFDALRLQDLLDFNVKQADPVSAPVTKPLWLLGP